MALCRRRGLHRHGHSSTIPTLARATRCWYVGRADESSPTCDAMLADPPPPGDVRRMMMRTNVIRNERMAVSYDVVNGWTVVEIDGDVDAHTSPWSVKQ